ncbi:MAG: YihY/virulence factor BrkB family protein, partial [Clostridia bacterium]|nr:YihY/virulence factor BrkB family protein [Clostridia bacterium]
VFGKSLSGALSDMSPFLSRLLLYLSRFRTLFGILYLSLFFCFTYLWLPNRKGRFHEQIPGALFAAAGWTVFSLLFAYYVDHFGNYANIYGSLTAIVVFMLWTYTCLYILFLGAELNRFLKRKTRQWNLRKRFSAALEKAAERAGRSG